MAEVKVIVKAHLNATEDPEKLEKAITNLFGDVKPQMNKEHGTTYLGFEATGINSLRQLRQRIASDRIRDATRVMLSRWAVKNAKITFHINRQAAYANHVSIYHASKSPLGPIEVEIDGEPDKIIELLTGKGPA